MPLQPIAICQLIALSVWTCLNAPKYINPRFRLVLSSQDVIAGLLVSAGLVFVPGLLDVLQSATPPSIAWIEALDTSAPYKEWAVYILVLRKPGFRPRIYIGSGTAYKRSARHRKSEYDRLVNLPEKVRDFVNMGYKITHWAPLLHCPIPTAAHVPVVRYLIVAVEAFLTCAFSTFYNPDKDYGAGNVFIWPRTKHSFDYDGLNTHYALLDTVWVDIDATPEQLEEMRAVTREKDLQYGREYGRKQRSAATPAFKAAQAAKNKKQKPRTRANQKVAVASQTFRCDPCNVNCRDNASLRRHQATPGHKRKIEYNGGPPRCVPCNKNFKYPSELEAHKRRPCHINKVKEDGS